MMTEIVQEAHLKKHTTSVKFDGKVFNQLLIVNFICVCQF